MKNDLENLNLERWGDTIHSLATEILFYRDQLSEARRIANDTDHFVEVDPLGDLREIQAILNRNP